MINIEIAKQIRISDYLHALGYTPVKQQQMNLWYFFPFRGENHPSFKLNMERNLWYDFGIGKGGNIITLAAELHKTNNLSYLLNQIENKRAHIRQTSFSFRPQPNAIPSSQELEIVPLTSPALIAYLENKYINTELAKEECKEARFNHNGRQYCAIAFPNVSKGYEIRSKDLKVCVSSKDISHIKNRETQNRTCYVFGDMIDYLSFLTIRKECSPEMPCLDWQDYIILNSAPNLSKALYPLADYEEIRCFLNNDSAGRKVYQELRDEYNIRVHDASRCYSDHNNINDYLCNCRKAERQRSYENNESKVSTEQTNTEYSKPNRGFKR